MRGAWEGNLRGQIDLATAHEAGWAGGFFALSAPSPPTELPAGREYALPPAPAVPREEAKRAVEAQLEVLEGLDVSIVRRASDFAEDRVNAIVHLDGAEPLDPVSSASTRDGVPRRRGRTRSSFCAAAGAWSRSTWRPRRSSVSPSSPAQAATVSTGRVGRYEKVEWPEVDLVNASFSLPFCPPEAFPAVWSRIVGSLRGGGRFAGQFFRPKDDWARTGLRTWTRVEVESLLAPFEVEMLDEHDRDGWVFTKPKHWHVFHVVARKV
jgi:hypothetical protein